MRAVCLIGFFSIGAVLWAQAPLDSEQINLSDSQDSLLLEWRIESADQALRSGLAGLAINLYRDILEEANLTSDDALTVQLRLSVSYIAQRRYAEAMETMAEIDELKRGARYFLYRSLAQFGDGRSISVPVIQATFDQVVPSDLEREDMAWYYLMQGLLAEADERGQVSRSYYEQAKEVASTVALGDFMQALIWRQEILSTPADAGLAAEVSAQLKKLSGQSAAYIFAKESAILLYNLGRFEEALAALSTELLPGGELDVNQRDELLLLKGMILGTEGPGRETLRNLVKNGKNRESMSIALQLLAIGDLGVRQEFTDFLNELIDRSAPHPLRGEMFFLRSQLALARGSKNNGSSADLALAESDARLLLEQFPGLSQITDTFRILAYVALLRDPPQYRAAADFLIQLRDQAPVAESRKALNRLIGDCYFLNEDYANAVDFYQAARQREVGIEQDGSLFLRLITAEVRAGNIEAAMQHIDDADFGGYVSVADRWRAEWNVARALLTSGANDKALQRVRLLLEGSVPGSVPSALELRLRWLEARLSLFAGETEGVADRVDLLIRRLESMPSESGSLDLRDTRLLLTELLLLKASILIDGEMGADGLAVLERLRTEYPQSSATERSYVVESNYHSSIGALDPAQKILLRLVQQYPESVLAPQALFEAAIYAEQRGPEFFDEAIRLHNDLAQQYPAASLVFRARLRQGDLLRQMNKFPAAQAVYENLINRYPDNARRYVAELSRADCLLALAKGDERQLQDAALALERLIDLPNLPVDVQVEVGYKWGFVLMQRSATSEAVEVFTMMFGRFLLDSAEAATLGRPGRYWMARLLLDLGEALSTEGKLTEARLVYRRMIAYKLPGSTIAQNRVSELQVTESVQ